MEQKTLLACRDVSLGYEGRAVWEHLNLEIRSGEYLCIVGENGSGKSTLLKSLLGLIKPLRAASSSTRPCAAAPSAICRSRRARRRTSPRR